MSTSKAGGKMCLYDTGMAQLLPDEPEPRVLRWADVAWVVVSNETDGDDDPKSALPRAPYTGTGSR